MIPSEYRLDTVVAGLVERLEGTRPTHGLDPDKASTAFREVAVRHVEAAVTEFKDNAVDGDPEVHAAFLRREVVETLLPRYTRLAVEMTRAESGGFGFRALAGPLGVPVLMGVAALGLVVLLRLAGWWEAWPLLALDLSLPLWPTVVTALYRRRYRQQLEDLVADAARIQDHERGFMTDEDVRAVRELGQQGTRPRPKEVDRG